MVGDIPSLVVFVLLYLV